MKPIRYIHHQLLLPAALLLIAAGCSRYDDDAASGAADLLPVSFSAISTRIAGADGNDAGCFSQYGILHARLSYTGKTAQDAVLTYKSDDGTWAAANPTLYWQSSAAGEKEQTLTLWRGAEGDFTLPAKMGATTSLSGAGAILNYALHDRLSVAYTGPATNQNAWELEHRMAQICVTLSLAAGTIAPSEEQLKKAIISMELPTKGNFDVTEGTVTPASNPTVGKVEFYQPNADKAVYYAVALPGATGTREITITVPDEKGDQTYRYTAAADIDLEAGSCHSFALALKVGVDPIGINIATIGWTPTPVAVTEGDAFIINNTAEGNLENMLPKVGYYQKIIVNGALNGTDYTVLKNFVNTYSFPVELEINVTGGSKTIPEAIFQDNQNPTSIVLTGITQIGANAFRNADLASVTLPNSLTAIGESAFEDCRSLTEITIPASVKTWGSCSFKDTGLTSVKLSDNLTTIGESAFEGCFQMTEIVIPSSVTTLKGTFKGCTGLTSVKLSNHLNTIGESVFEGCRNMTEITIPSSVTTLGEKAFNNTGLKSVKLPDGLKTIGKFAFQDCTQLKEITIPAGITILNEGAFSNTGLTSIKFPSGMKTIGQTAFQNCSKLKQVDISTDMDLGGWSFDNTGLTELTLPEGMKTFGSCAFASCKDLEKVMLPVSFEVLPREAFRDDSGLKRMGLSGTKAIPYGGNSFNNVDAELFLYDKGITTAGQIESWKTWGITWSKVHYGYKGSGDKLDPNNYSSHYNRT